MIRDANCNTTYILFKFSRNSHLLTRFLACLIFIAIPLHTYYIRLHCTKLQAYTYLVGKDQSADEHLCIKTAGCKASAEDISYTAASHATRAISLFRPNPSYFSPPGCPLSPPYPPFTQLPSRRPATVSVHPSFPIVAPVSPDDYRSSALVIRPTRFY